MPVAKRSNSITESALKQEVLVPVSTWRYATVGVIFGGLFLGLIARAVYLQVIDTDYLQSQGDARYLRVMKEAATRGMIVDRNDRPLAISTPVDSIWIHPSTILEQYGEYSYTQLGELLGISVESIIDTARQKKASQFAYLKRHISPQLADQILGLGIKGVDKVREYKRYYPAGPVLGQCWGLPISIMLARKVWNWLINLNLKANPVVLEYCKIEWVTWLNTLSN